MTAAQKINAERFKKAIAEAKKLRKKNPKLTQAQAVKQAWAILYKTGKVAGTKKTATKKTAKKKAKTKSYHKDTKSHNVNIRVMSGTMGEISDSVIHTIKEYDKKRNEHDKKYKFWKENAKMYGRSKNNPSLKYAREHKNMASYYTKQIQKLRLKIK
jgi:hypothetical protein